MKKMISLILALVMVLGLAVSASAATVTITAPDTNGDISQTTYTAYKVFSGSFGGQDDANKVYTIKTTDPFYSTVNAASNLFTLTAVPGSTTELYVTANADATGEAIAAALNAATDKGTGIASTYSDGKYTITIPEDAEGYYLIVSSFGTGLIVDTVGNSNITLQPKNTFPSLTKTADKTTAAFGEEVTYTVTVTIPATANSAIVVHDTMTNLTYVADSVSAKVGEDAVAVTAAESETCACSIEFTLSEEVVKANVGKSVVITYKATVNANATEGTNKAHLTYSDFTSTDVTTTVKNYKIDVYKYTGTDNAKTGLDGAGFVLKNANGKYYKLTDDIVSWVDSIDEATEYITASETYTVTFAGLANGTYTLEEKSVPAGYNKANDVEVTIEDADKTGTTQVEVLNQTGSKLPSTGGMGTTLFYVVGGLLMAGAAVLLITKKRMA